MVNRTTITTIVRVLQLVAVMGGCFNHWSITLLKGTPPFFSSAAYSAAALLGLTFLFFSSGFLSQLSFSTHQESSSDRNFCMDFIVGRYWRLLLPVLAAVAFDYWLQGFADHSQTSDVPRALPFLLTLTQTWHYSILGATSLAEPAGGSNMARLGANLFFLAILFGATAPFWNRIRSVRALCLILAVCAVVLAVFLNVVNHFLPQINGWAADRYGVDLPSAYGFAAWLVEYCPFVHIPTFLVGVLLARLCQVAEPSLLSGVLIAALLFGIFVPGHAAYLGWSVVLVVIVTRWASVFLDTDSRCSRLLVSSGLLARLGACAYEVYVLHLVIYLAFTLAVMPAMNAYGVTLLAGRVLAVNGFMLLLCLGLAELYFFRGLARLTSARGCKNIGDLCYV
jgi:hypothetical protein